MEIIDKKMREEILQHYRDEREKEVLNKQMDHMNSFIQSHILRYTHSQDFRKAVDLMLVDLLNGKFLGR